MRFIFLMIALLSLLLLASCGGGGSSSSNLMPSMLSPPTPNQLPATTQTAFSGIRPQNTNAVAQNGGSLVNLFGQPDNPQFGSVLQAYTHNLSNVHGVDTSYDGHRFTLQFNRQDGSSTALDTASDEVYRVNEYTASTNPVTNRPAVDGYIASLSNSAVTATAVSIEWSNTDFTDYLAGGYWIHVDLNTPGIELGAFIDGPNYESTVDVPVTGTATYNGSAAGFYMVSYGADVVQRNPTFALNTLEQGEYSGDLRLVANFGTNSISGDIRNLDLSYAYALTPNGELHELSDGFLSGYQLALGAAPIHPNGQFVGNSVMLVHPNITFASMGGSWAGRFSTVDDSSGVPRAVAGTHRGYLESAGGTQAMYVGAHYGATERFQ